MLSDVVGRVDAITQTTILNSVELVNLKLVLVSQTLLISKMVEL